MTDLKATDPEIRIGRGRRGGAGAGRRLATYSFGLNSLLTIAKYVLYLLTGSTALLAETVHSLTDVVGSLLVLGGIHLAGKKSVHFPWGLYKAENLAALLCSSLIFASGYEIGRSILHPPTGGMQHLDTTLAVLVFMALPIFLFSRYERGKALELNSPLLLADAENWRTDLAPLAIVTAGIAGARFSYPALDRIAACVVLFLVLKAGYEIARDAVKSLLDASVEAATLEEITRIVKGFPDIAELVYLSARNSGRYIFVDLKVRMSLKRLREAHESVDRLEREIRQCIPFVEKVTVQYEPVKKESTRYAALLASPDGRISEHFGAAPFLALWDVRGEDGVVLSGELVENPFVATEKAKGMKLAEFLVARGVDIVYTKEAFANKGPGYVMSDAGIEVLSTDAATIDGLVPWNQTPGSPGTIADLTVRKQATKPEDRRS